jgi:hypothetical protein
MTLVPLAIAQRGIGYGPLSVAGLGFVAIDNSADLDSDFEFRRRRAVLPLENDEALLLLIL